MTDKVVFIDESGNLGRQGRYFVLAAVVLSVEGQESIRRRLHQLFTELKYRHMGRMNDHGEIKASNVSISERATFLAKVIDELDFQIFYVVADLKEIIPNFKEQASELYDLLALELMKMIVDADAELEEVTITFDERDKSEKISRRFHELLDIHVWEEWQRAMVKPTVDFQASHHSIFLQLADFVANAIYENYELREKRALQSLEARIINKTHYPKNKMEL